MNNCLKHIFKNSKKKCKYDDLQGVPKNMGIQ